MAETKHGPAVPGAGTEHRQRPTQTGQPAPAGEFIREGRVRAVIDAVSPMIDGGRFPVKRIAGRPRPAARRAALAGHRR
jgi:starch synthase (maltosyl-transferring)